MVAKGKWDVGNARKFARDGAGVRSVADFLRIDARRRF